jgi:UPF0271 protein
MNKIIDLNSDIGERLEAIADGSEEKLISIITSANIACGGHAGNEDTMNKIVTLCKKYNVNIGAHPSYPDKENFGRIEMELSPNSISNFVFDQINNLVNVAKELGAKVIHVKPHGAIYNSATKDGSIAKAIADGVKRINPELILVGLAGSIMLGVWKEMGFKVIGEAFADRRYEPDGSLRSREFSDALITDPIEAANQALMIARDGKVKTSSGEEININAQTICIHSDTENSLQMAKEIHKSFRKEKISISPIK